MKKTISLLLSAFLICAFLSPAFAENADGSYYALVSEGLQADGFFVVKVPLSSGTAGIEAALKHAKNNATDKTTYKIVVEPGQYIEESGLHLFSNTYLYLHGVTIMRSDSPFNMFKVGTAGEDPASGYYYRNITVDGGVLDENMGSNTLFKIGHAKNVTLLGVTFENTTDGHLVETAGVDGLTVDHCTFLNIKHVSPGFANEAIQIDLLAAAHFNGYAILDAERDTCITKNVTITNSTFGTKEQNIIRAVGAHTAVNGVYYQNIKIENNNIYAEDLGILCSNFQHCFIRNNIIHADKNCIVFQNMSGNANGYYLPSSGNGVNIEDSDTVVCGNTLVSNTLHGIYIGGTILTESKKGEDTGNIMPAGKYPVKGIMIDANTISTPEGNSICLSFAGNISVTNNKIIQTGADRYGILVYNGSVGGIRINKNTISSKCKDGINVYSEGSVFGTTAVETIDGNTVSAAQDHAILLYTAKASEISNNVISGTGYHGINIYSGSAVSKISGNVISSTAENAVNIASKSKVTGIFSNTIKGTKNGKGIYVDDTSAVAGINSNKISGTKSRAISISGVGSEMKISANTISASVERAIVLYAPNKKHTVSISSNKITGNKNNYGIQIVSGSAAIGGNTVQSCQYPVKIDSGASVTLYPNTYSGNSSNTARIVGNKTYYYGNLASVSASVAKKSATSIKISWKKNGAATGYLVYRATEANGSYQRVATVSKNDTLTFTNSSLKKGKTYYYKVRTYKTVPGSSVILYSNTVTTKGIQL